ncbi:MAG: bifunctional hydroxymethylpyrimidine kinase/phosphomethylpyrimidine kinase [Candidatus Omnitrophica bacterium]|nr:bifunctional hydroxymethylpyrimidine kinase/phosphomethylpyrimidine kinase [Candidatus Omnitrophota bacterium]
MKLLIIGSVAMDSVKTPFGKNPNALGGSASYAAVSASYFTSAKIISVIGGDFPARHIKIFKNKHIDTSGIEVLKNKRTFKWSGEYGWDMNSVNTISTHLNVLADFNPMLSGDDKKCRFIFLANNDPDIQLDVIKQVSSSNNFIAADTIEYWIKNKKKKLLRVLKQTDIFIINEKEARLLTSEANLIKAAKRIIAWGAKKVIIKKGEHGLLYMTKNRLFLCPAYPQETVYDPTGAGDTFAGAFLGYLASLKRVNERAYIKALIYGTIMASYNVEGFGLDKLLKIDKSLIQKRYREFTRSVRF